MAEDIGNRQKNKRSQLTLGLRSVLEFYDCYNIMNMLSYQIIIASDTMVANCL